MNTIRITFEDGIIYDWPVPQVRIDKLTKLDLLLEAAVIAEEWHRLAAAECSLKDSFITKIEWYAYNFNKI